MQTDPYNTLIVEDLQLAIGIDGVDFTQTRRYFEIVLTHTSRPLGGSQTRTEVAMESCQIGNWENIGENFGKLFEVHGMDQMLCPVAGEDISLEGFAGSENWEILEIRIEKCVNRTGITWACYSQADIDAYVSAYEAANDYFEVNIFIVDTVFTPLQQVYTTKAIE